MQAAITETRTIVKSLTWDGARQSNPVEIFGHVHQVRLELPAAFVGTAITYEWQNAADQWVPIHVLGLPLTDVVAGGVASLNLCSPLLTCIPRFRVVSDQVETCTGRLLATS